MVVAKVVVLFLNQIEATAGEYGVEALSVLDRNHDIRAAGNYARAARNTAIAQVDYAQTRQTACAIPGSIRCRLLLLLAEVLCPSYNPLSLFSGTFLWDNYTP